MTWFCLLIGVLLVLILTVPTYSRALVLSGRSEVVTMRLDKPDFGHLSFGSGTWMTDADQAAATGRATLDLDSGTLVRFDRRGRGPLRLSFEAKPNAVSGDCGESGKQVGSRTMGGQTASVCDVSSAVIALPVTGEPLVIALSGLLTVGEEVSQGVGARPILLEGTASLLVRHDGWFFRQICHWAFEHICDRFTANMVTLSPGNSVRMAPKPATAPADQKASALGVGFVRIDPANYESGMMFLLSADALAFEVIRIEGETYTVRESLFDVIAKSPLVHTLNGALAAGGLIWFFLKLGRKEGAHEGH